MKWSPEMEAVQEFVFKFQKRLAINNYNIFSTTFLFFVMCTK